MFKVLVISGILINLDINSIIMTAINTIINIHILPLVDPTLNIIGYIKETIITIDNSDDDKEDKMSMMLIVLFL